MEVRFELGQRVKIKTIDKYGKVIGIWRSLYGVDQYNVRYFDSTERRTDIWCPIDDIEVVR